MPVIFIVRSSLEAWFLWVWHSLNFLSIAWIQWPVWARLGLYLIVGVSAVVQYCRYVNFIPKRLVLQQSKLYLLGHGGQPLLVKLRRPAYCTPYLLIITLQPSVGASLSLVLWADSSCREHLRRLRVWVRCAPRGS